MNPLAVTVTLRRCARHFHHHQALQPLDLTVHPGETLVLLGPSGCGKTTTLRIISGLESCDAGGEVWFDDRNVTALPIEKRNVGMVFQNYALFPNLNVAENVAYGLKVQGVARAEREARVQEMLELVDLSALAQRSIDKLSGGQKQRVALARALAARPKVLLFDEPLAALDARLRDRLRLEIGALLKKLAITAVYVTHDQQEAMALGDRIAVMERGRLVQIDTPQNIYQQPASKFVADFVGAINCVDVDARGNPLRFCRPEDVLLASDNRYRRQGFILASTFLGASQRLMIDIGLATPIQVDRHAREAWHAGQPVSWMLAQDAALQFA
ncbi:ABC transporter ATP-binding protein [Candidatus Pantoea floridensis]|uniref:Putative spermidine/putrescine transport system ATP-binding protein n=1 Tax=Candidatus Pantoea floridensis TaxID=1938870 RepID=A0A286BWM9_9GAMM|nr:ABC transporter ATP-binding protein [Pantoea floridensis]PIF21046.1 putative spermidine/putrescine transport system ATP-binding protein [Enterobacteriaceae bacterium JKS000233]SOD38562.1 putative spermidine/putrescine transport system ATP-binding protein [Pantoea floridensis]